MAILKAYKAFRDNAGGYVKPNVSLCDDNDKVYYNYPIWDTNDKPFVDLDLPSGTLWATMNVGASKPSDAGFYFQWGDTQGYTADQVGKDKQFDWSDYKWYLSGSTNDENIAFKKYTTTGVILELEDDAAHVNMGVDWHMPTPDQIKELIAETTTAWTTSDGISGVSFASKKDSSKSIFFPAAGHAQNSSVQTITNSCQLWSSMLGKGLELWPSMLDACNVGISFHFFSNSLQLSENNRCDGISVRGVLG